jgi:hypothetical protein
VIITRSGFCIPSYTTVDAVWRQSRRQSQATSAVSLRVRVIDSLVSLRRERGFFDSVSGK